MALIRITPVVLLLGLGFLTLWVAPESDADSNKQAGALRLRGEIPVGRMPPGALNPQFAHVTGSPGLDLIVGHKIPFVAGVKDPRGRLRIYPNMGTATKPLYERGFWLDARVPTARIPSG